MRFSFFQEAFEAQGNALPALRDLTLHGWDYHTQYSCKSFVQQFHGLTSLRTHAVNFDWLDSPSVLPNLRRLVLTSCPSVEERTIQFWTSLQNLTELDVNFGEREFPRADAIAAVYATIQSLSKLVALGIRVEMMEDLEFLKGFSRLTRLMVRSADSEYSAPRGPWHARSAYCVSLKELSLDRYVDSFLHSVPTAFPNIQVLTLNGNDPRTSAPLSSLLALKHLVLVKHYYASWDRTPLMDGRIVHFGHPTATLCYFPLPTHQSRLLSWT